jgi:hypothetical protein
MIDGALPGMIDEVLPALSFRGARKASEPGIQKSNVLPLDSGFAASPRPGMTGRELDA